MTGIYIDDGVEAASDIFGELEHCIHEDILQSIVDPAAVTAEVSKLLIGINHENVVVRRLAKDIAKAIAFEHAFKDSDMLVVIRKLDAILEPMIAWLERHDVDCRSLRSPVRVKNNGGF